MQFHFKIKGANSISNGLSTVPYALRAISIATLSLRNLPRQAVPIPRKRLRQPTAAPQEINW